MPKGGTRPAARGRPKGYRVPTLFRRVQLTGVRLPAWMIDWLNERSRSTGISRGKLIEEALIAYYGLKPPKGE